MSKSEVMGFTEVDGESEQSVSKYAMINPWGFRGLALSTWKQTHLGSEPVSNDSKFQFVCSCQS